MRQVNSRSLSRIDNPDRLRRITAMQASKIIEYWELWSHAFKARIRRRQTLRGETNGHDISTRATDQSFLVQPFMGKHRKNADLHKSGANDSELPPGKYRIAALRIGIDGGLAAEYRVRRARTSLMPEWIQTLTVDASYSSATGITGFGIVIQERSGRSGRGPIVEQLSESHHNISAGDGELYAVFRALEVAKHRGFTRIKLRSDYNHMRRSLRERYRDGSVARDLEGCVLQLAKIV